jgi:hypothetical protein
MGTIADHDVANVARAGGELPRSTTPWSVRASVK